MLAMVRSMVAMMVGMMARVPTKLNMPTMPMLWLMRSMMVWRDHSATPLGLDTQPTGPGRAGLGEQQHAHREVVARSHDGAMLRRGALGEGAWRAGRSFVDVACFWRSAMVPL